MKKIIYTFMLLVLLTGCSLGNMDNTPTKKVEAYLNNYQKLDNSVLDDLETIINSDTSIVDDDRENYREFMKSHYRDLEYEIKDETIDGDSANVVAVITVRNYAPTMTEVDNYKTQNESKFNNESGAYDPVLFSSYRLEQLKKVKETSTYTINFTLTKQDDKWVLNQLSDEDLNKINGLYSQ